MSIYSKIKSFFQGLRDKEIIEITYIDKIAEPFLNFINLIKEKSKKIFRFFFIIILVIWLIFVASSFNGLVLNQTYWSMDLTENNIYNVNILMVTSLLIIFLFPLYLFISKRKETLINLYKNHLYSIVYNLFLLLEIIIGVYLAVTTFEFGYTNYDPRLSFFIVTLTLLIIIQYIKKITLSRINHWEIK